MRRAIALLAVCVAIASCSGVAQVDPHRYAEPPRDSITFWGHACVFVDAGGLGFVTDPVFEKGLWQRRRFIGSPPPEVLQRVRVILLSHAHDDHTSPESLALFGDGVTILGPPPAVEFLAKQGIAAKAMRPGDEHVVDGVRFIAVAVHHAGGRMSVTASADGDALGWVVVTPAATLFYSGDTDYCSTFSDVGWTYAPDIAILNVNGHLMPADASRAARATRAPVVIPAHWGGYGYWVVGGNRHPRGEAQLARLLGKRLHVLAVGKSLPLSRPAKEH
ncbi:MAG TPA: MBL fold metallo-hydrolase [Candidatus Krumholzibacteria bacterium]